MEFVPSKRDKLFLVLDGYLYNTYWSIGRGQKWQGVNRHHCFAAVWTAEDLAKVVHGPKQHAHPSDWGNHIGTAAGEHNEAARFRKQRGFSTCHHFPTDSRKGTSHFSLQL